MKRHLFALVAIAACLASAAFAQNTVTVGATALTFNAVLNAAPPAAQTISVNSTTPITFNTQINQPNSWLTAIPASFTTPSSISVSVNHAGLPVGTYTGYVFVNAPGAVNPTTQIVVTLNVLNSSQMVANPSPLSFGDITVGSTQPVSQALTVTAGQPVPFRAAATMNTGSGWLAVSPETATTPATLQVTVNPTNLTAGTYTGKITLTPIGGITAVEVQVTVNITAAPRLAVSPTALTFNWQVNTSAPAAQSLDIAASNNATLPVTIEVSPSVPWLFLSTTSTATRSSVQVAISPTAAALGVNKTKLLIKSTGAANSPVEVPVTLNVSVTPLLTANPSSLSFTYQSGGTVPAAQKVAVGSTGTALQYNAAVDQTWLTLPPSGTTGADLSISLSQTGLVGLGPGTYNGNVTLTPVGSGIPLAIPVQLIVTNYPMLSADRTALLFNFQVNGALPAAQRVSITSTGAPLTYGASVSTNSGGTWLAVDGSTGNTPGGFNVAVNPAGLAEGTYTGTVTVNATGSANTLSLPVTLYVSARPLLNVDPYALTLTAQRNGAPISQEIRLTSTSATDQITFTAAKGSGADWLSIGGTTTGQTPARLVVTALPSFVPDVGTYSGSITITSTAGSPGTAIANSPLTIPVTLSVTSGALSVSNTSLTFSQVAGAAAPAAQTVTVTNSIGASTFGASASVPAGAPAWLSVTPSSGTTPGTLSISVNPANLQPGTYSGTVTVSIPGAANSPQNIQVTYTISAAALTVSPTSLSFTQNVGGAAPATQKLSVASGGVPVNFTASVTAGSNWLSITPQSGTTPADITVSVNGAGLAQGTYDGAITIGTITVPVRLTVSAAQSLVVTPTTLNFTVQTGGGAPAPQAFQVASSGAALTFTLNIATSPGTGWMTVSPTTGNTPQQVNVGITPTNLGAGNYTGTILVAAPGAMNTPQTVTVNLTVQPPPAPSGIVLRHSATGAPSMISPGLLVSIYGTGLGPTPAVQSRTATGNMETTLGETRVYFDDIPAPVWYVSGTQINAIVPYEIAGRPTVRFQVEYKGQRSTPITLAVQDALPGIFTQNQSGSGPGSILNQDYSINTSSRPAAKGSVVLVYATGEGATVPAGQSGQIIPGDGSLLKHPVQDPTATIGGVPARVLYAGSAPGFVSGVLQVNVEVPADAPSGAQPIVIKVGNNSSSPGVTVAIQ